jgi:hypothetical protein
LAPKTYGKGSVEVRLTPPMIRINVRLSVFTFMLPSKKG